MADTSLFGGAPPIRIDERRVGADGFAEYLTARLERSVVMTVVVPEGYPVGASLRVATGHHKYFYVQIPEGVAPGNQLSVQVPESSLIPDGGEAPPQEAAPIAAEWRTLADLGTAEQMSFALNHEDARMRKLQREARGTRTWTLVVCACIYTCTHTAAHTGARPARDPQHGRDAGGEP